jgi:hypothetical protein
MKVFIFITIGLFLSLRSFDEPEVWLVKPTSGLIVQGNSNVNSFSCKVPSIGCFDTIVVENKNLNEIINIDADLNIALQLFDCGNKMMTKDLLKTLNAAHFPYMKISFKSLDRNLSKMQVSHVVSVNTVIELAGVKKKIQVEFSTKSINQNKIELIGEKVICFSDFGLKPPTKMAGTIRVKDQLEVELRMMLERSN